MRTQSIGKAAIGLWLAFSTACYTNAQIPPPALAQLNGFRENDKLPLATVDGDVMDFTQRTELRFESDTGEKIRAKFSAIDVEGNYLNGEMRPNRTPLSVDLTRLSKVDAHTFSVGRTVGLAVGLSVGAIILLSVIAVVAAGNSNSNNSDAHVVSFGR